MKKINQSYDYILKKPSLELGKCYCGNFESELLNGKPILCKNCPFKQTMLCDTFSYLISQGYKDFESCVVVLLSTLRKLRNDFKNQVPVNMITYRNYDLYVDKYGNLKEWK